MTQYELLALTAKYGSRAFSLKGADQSFLLTLLSYWNHTTNECYPANESVKDGCGIEATNLHRNKKALIAAGVISGKKEDLTKQMGDGKKHSQYVLQIDFMIKKLKEVASQVEEENNIKFQKEVADGRGVFVEPEEQSPWDAEPEPKSFVSALALPEVKTEISVLTSEPIAIEPITSTPEPEESPMTISPDELQKMREEAARHKQERAKRIAERDGLQSMEEKEIDNECPW